MTNAGPKMNRLPAESSRRERGDDERKEMRRRLIMKLHMERLSDEQIAARIVKSPSLPEDEQNYEEKENSDVIRRWL